MTIKKNSNRTKATVKSYTGRLLRSETDFMLEASCTESIEVINEMFEDCPFSELLLHFALCGIALDFATDKLVLKLDNGNISHVWIANKED